VLSLVKSRGVEADRIIALAFTRVAANQLRNDLRAALRDGRGSLKPGVEEDKDNREPLCSTIHGFALRQILRNGRSIDALPSPVRVADDFFERAVVLDDLKDLMGARRVSEVKDELQLLSAAWEKNFSPDELRLRFAERNPVFLSHWEEHRRVYGYTLRAEMVYQVKQMLELNPSFRLESDFQHLIVDEYQDLNACFNQLPCLGVEWNSSRVAIRRASSGVNASYSAPSTWVFRLSNTTRTFSAFGKWTSTSAFITWANSRYPRRAVTSRCRQPSNGQSSTKTLAVPFRVYS
jgi:UvrD/REP helicase N-terminal domain